MRAAAKKRQRKLVNEWNEAHPVGTPVLVRSVKNGPETETKTRSEAYLASSGDAAIFLEGKSGFWCLDGFVRPAVKP